MSEKSFLHVKNNSVFRMFFADERNQDLLISFLKSVVKLPDDDYNEIVITDPHLLPEYKGDKLSIIDVKLRTKSGKIIQIEIQLEVRPEMHNRIIFYGSKLITEQLGAGDEYREINQVISIIITKEKLINNSAQYHHRFTFYDPDAKIELSDIIEIHTLELSKLPEGTDGTLLYDWAKFIDAENEEELNMVAERNPEVKKAVVRLEVLSGDERARYIAELEEKARRDMVMHIDYATAQGKAESDKKWQSVVADKDVEIARLRAELEARKQQ
ncbi:MAG: Rpn family recombination-promoting nuclease/putative transposase [Treponema sp.]|nr:Rpn family recombination-promoting nuclease/putative transposase [Treponema sp.]